MFYIVTPIWHNTLCRPPIKGAFFMLKTMNNQQQEQDRKALIKEIESLYPPDSMYEDTAEIGVNMLVRAIKVRWRELPIEFLEELSKNCIDWHDKH